MGTIGFSCSPVAIYDNMLPANASEKFVANSYKERGGGMMKIRIEEYKITTI